MGATVAAALKKLAVAVLTNKKLRKVVFGIVLGILIIILMPIAAVLALFNGTLEFDTAQLQEMIAQNLTAEQEAQMQAAEDTMYAIQDAMTAAGFSGRTVDAQVLFVLALQDYAHQQDFVSRLVGCFSENQSDEQLIAAVNAAFGTALSSEDFRKVMASVRGVHIDTSNYVDCSTKTTWIWYSGPLRQKRPGGAMCGAPMVRCLTRLCMITSWSSTRRRWVAMRNSSSSIGWAGGVPIASASSRATDGLTRRAAPSPTVPTVCRIRTPTACMSWLLRKGLWIPCLKSPAWRSGTGAILGSTLETAR